MFAGSPAAPHPPTQPSPWLASKTPSANTFPTTFGLTWPPRLPRSPTPPRTRHGASSVRQPLVHPLTRANAQRPQTPPLSPRHGGAARDTAVPEGHGAADPQVRSTPHPGLRPVPTPLRARAPFSRLVRELGDILKKDVRFTQSSVDALQEAAEAFLVRRMRGWGRGTNSEWCGGTRCACSRMPTSAPCTPSASPSSPRTFTSLAAFTATALEARTPTAALPVLQQQHQRAPTAAPQPVSKSCYILTGV